MRLSSSLLPPLVVALTLASNTSALDELPTNLDDFDEPDWEQIIEAAFPTWKVPRGGCPRLDEVGGKLVKGFKNFPEAEEGSFNPCYYTKAFAGLDPLKGGYPTPIDTHYPYEFAAPFFKQPGDGSTHHCPVNANPDTPVQSCPKVNSPCPGGQKDCVVITDDYGIGHIPPFVPLAAIKNEYNTEGVDACAWFDFDTSGCNIPKSVLDGLIYKYFGDGDKIEFQPPILVEEAPSNTYYRLEYVKQGNACDAGNCRGPHYCSEEAAAADIWGDFCPYVHTGENAGMYRHPHIALAALELWIANQCNNKKCPSKWLDSPNGQGYGKDEAKSTSITWAEMDDNDFPISQPIVPYKWPNAGTGLFPGHELYDNMPFKAVTGSYVTEFVFGASIDDKSGKSSKNSKSSKSSKSSKKSSD
mmetsp:Transcript_1031/g.1902  ORF Transcript_1031/g.1902 Transcript_1031/m.1902 type:complete len:414 (-) Transcript_1031:1720-2961(-)